MNLFLIRLGRPVVFIHIPKTGGTSVRTAGLICGFELFKPKEEWKDYPSFAVVRNPYDRIESCYRNFRYSRPWKTKLNFEDFIMVTNARPDLESRIGASGTAESHTAPMSHPVNGIAYAKDILRFETLQKDFDNFCEKNELFKFVLPRLNTSDGTPRCKWTPRARELTERFYAEDFKRWYN